MYAIRSYYASPHKRPFYFTAKDGGPLYLACIGEFHENTGGSFAILTGEASPPRAVITSYSIHYTKLYEQSNSQRWLRDFRRRRPLARRQQPDREFLTRRITWFGRSFVITSYSIHYTKLYESVVTAAADSSISSEAQEELVRNLQALGYVGGGVSPGRGADASPGGSSAERDVV